MNEEIKQKFCREFGSDRVLLEEPMKRHTTFRIGGPAEVFVMPGNLEEVQRILEICRTEDLPYFILGNGSNLLVSDRGYRGVVIQLDRNFGEVKVEGTEIHASAGALLSTIAVAARRASLTGFEFAGGIPGTLGGAVVMNAGAYGGEMKDVLRKVMVMDQSGKVFEIPAEELQMGYRTSIIKTAGYIVLGAVLSLKEGNLEEIKMLTRKLSEQRTSKQPLEYPSAGSTFKRPEGYFAGKLISDAGLKGFSVGGAQVSEKHAGFVINKGNATASDVIELTNKVSDKIYELNGVRLELEVKKLGF